MYPRHTFLHVGRNWYYTFLVCATSPMHAAAQPLSDTIQPHTMSDGDICSNDEKYGGFGAMMANSLRCQEERQEEREQRAARSLSVFSPKTAAVAASRASASKNPPPSLSSMSPRLLAASVWPTTSRLPQRTHLQRRSLLLRPRRIWRPRPFFLTIPRQWRQ